MADVVGGTIIWNLDADASKLKAALSSAESSVKGLAKDVDKHMGGVSSAISKSFKSAEAGSKAFAIGILGVGTAIAGVAGFALKGAGEMEMLRSSMDTLTGSAENGAKIFKELNAFGASTPFETKHLAKASETMLSFGIAASDVLPNLQMLGDISLGNKDKLGSLSLAFSKVQSTGKLMGENLQQMIDQGFNPLTIMSQKTGKSISVLKDEMAAGNISFDMFKDVMKTATTEGGLFYGGMERGSKTLTGVLSTLQDQIGMTVRKIVGLSDTGDVIKGGLFDKVKDAATTLINFLQANEDLIMGTITQTFQFIIDNGAIIAGIIIGGLVPAVTAMATSMWALVAPLLPFLAIGAVMGVVIKMLIDRMGGWEVVQGKVTEALKGMSGIYNALLKPALDFLIGTIVNDLIPAFKKWWDLISPILLPVLKFVAVFLAGAFVGAIIAVVIVLGVLIKTFSIVLDVISGFISWVVSGIGYFVHKIVGFFTWLYDTLVGHSIVPDLVRDVIASFGNMVIGVIGKVTEIANKVISIFLGIVGGVKNALGEIWNGVSSTLGEWVGKIYDWGKNIAGSFVRGFKDALSGIKDAAIEAFNAAKNFIQGNSPPKEGPLKNIDKWGFNIGDAWVSGMSEAMSGFSLAGVADNFGLQPALATTGSQSGYDGGNKTINITVNAELGSDMDIDRLLERLQWSISKQGLL